MGTNIRQSWSVEEVQVILNVGAAKSSIGHKEVN